MDIHLRVVRITHETSGREIPGKGHDLFVGPSRIKKELLWEGVRDHMNPPVETFIELGVLVEKDEDEPDDVLHSIEHVEKPVYTYELEFRTKKSAMWKLRYVFSANTSSELDPLEELECDDEPEVHPIIEDP